MKSLFKISRQELKRVLIHIPLGLLVCLLGYVGWWLPVIFAAVFVVYEVDEDFHLRNGAYTDLKGILWGIGIGGIAMLVLKLMGVI